MTPKESTLPACMAWACLSLVIHAGGIAVLGLVSFQRDVPEVPPVINVQLRNHSQHGIAPVLKQSVREKKPMGTQMPGMIVKERSLSSFPKGSNAASPLRLPSPSVAPAITSQGLVIPTPIDEIGRRLFMDDQLPRTLLAREMSKLVRNPPLQSSSGSIPISRDKLEVLAAHGGTTSINHQAMSGSEMWFTKSERPSRRSLPVAPPGGKDSVEITRVKLVRSIPPVYPRVAREEGWEGTVIVRVQVRPDGTPRHVGIQKSSGHEVLDRAAIQAISKWRFTPAQDGNIPISSLVEIPVRFNLTKG